MTKPQTPFLVFLFRSLQYEVSFTANEGSNDKELHVKGGGEAL